ncbi:MAG: helix-turn-helix domain-containing protein [Clostridiales bacterium]|nr:helix-turn-helix domain-containing protein [Clostridiales bacterium]
MVSQKDLKMLVFLFELAEKQQSITIEELAERFEISNRTVRNNLGHIDYYLKSNHLPQLKRDRKSEISLDMAPDELAESRRNLRELNTENYVFSKEERILYLKLLLFDADGYVTYEQLSQTLFVSRKTVIDDVHQVKDDCEKWKIQLLGTKRGLKYSGEEADVRRFLTDALLEMFTPLELWEILRDIYPNKSTVIEKKWHNVAGNDMIRVAEERLREAEQKTKTSLTDAQYYMLIVLTMLTLNRKAKRKSPGEMMPEEWECRKVPEYLRAFCGHGEGGKPAFWKRR